MRLVKFAHALSFLMIGTAAFLIGCKGSGEGNADVVSEKPSVPAVAYAQVQPILTSKCAGCHGAVDPKDGVKLTDYAGVVKIVKPGDPASSKLIQVMKGGEGHKRMPPMGEPVPATDIKVVEDWIQGGAKES
ncbi:hypothetical protein EON81_23160 [bacterium]|nr:MAG: hypothetical protein EON81_23160 [bacterium]